MASDKPEMKIEELEISATTLEKLKGVGFEFVEDVIIYVTNLEVLPNTYNPSLGNDALEETIVTLERMGLWHTSSE